MSNVNDMTYKHKSNLILNKLKFRNFGYIPGLCETLRYALKKFDINLVTKTTGKFKDLIHNKIYPIPKDEIAGIYIIPLVTETQEENVYITREGLPSGTEI